MRRATASLAACLAGALGLPAAAPAFSTVELTARGSGDSLRETLTIRGSGGADTIGYTRELSGVVIRDPGGVQAGTGCVPVDGEAGTAARCALRDPSGPDIGSAAGGDGDDVLALRDLFRELGSIEGGPGDDVVEGDRSLSGGPGADVLRGGLNDDVLDGGPGADLLEGGLDTEYLSGDHVSYRDRTAGVRVDLATGLDAGEPGEGDRLVGIEGVAGGTGDDVLTGSPRDDRLYGGPGDDRLTGGAGDDTLRDGYGGATLDGGPGDDWLSTAERNPLGASPVTGAWNFLDHPPGRAELLGGEGRDMLFAGEGADRLDGGPDEDRLALSGRRGGDRVDLRDGSFDRVQCDARARVRADAQDLASGCGRAARNAPARPWLSFVADRLSKPRGGVSRIAVRVACANLRGRCRGLVRAYAAGRMAGARAFSVAAGEQGRARIELDPRVARLARRRGAVGIRFRLDAADAEGIPVRQTVRARLCSPRPAACAAG